MNNCEVMGSLKPEIRHCPDSPWHRLPTGRKLRVQFPCSVHHTNKLRCWRDGRAWGVVSLNLMRWFWRATWIDLRFHRQLFCEEEQNGFEARCYIPTTPDKFDLRTCLPKKTPPWHPHLLRINCIQRFRDSIVPVFLSITCYFLTRGAFQFGYKFYFSMGTS